MINGLRVPKQIPTLTIMHQSVVHFFHLFNLLLNFYKLIIIYNLLKWKKTNIKTIITIAGRFYLDLFLMKHGKLLRDFLLSPKVICFSGIHLKQSFIHCFCMCTAFKIDVIWSAKRSVVAIWNSVPDKKTFPTNSWHLFSSLLLVCFLSIPREKL